DAMAVDYPAIVHFLGEHAFGHLIADYVQEHPSRSYTFNRLGDDFPKFLESRRAFLADLARLELAMTQVFDEEESVAAAAAAAATPEEMRLTPIKALRLL